MLTIAQKYLIYMWGEEYFTIERIDNPKNHGRSHKSQIPLLSAFPFLASNDEYNVLSIFVLNKNIVTIL